MKKTEALEHFDRALRIQRKAKSTRDSYLTHLRSYGKFKPENPVTTPEEKVSAFLSWIAMNRSEETQRQALNALVSFYRAMDRPLENIPAWLRPRQKKRVPAWVNTTEARLLIDVLDSPWSEMAAVMFGSGLRIGEVISLRIKDVDLENHTITIRRGKGDKDRVTVLAQSISGMLRARIEQSRRVWTADRKAGANPIYLPDGLERKFPNAGAEFAWFWMWPARRESTDPETKIVRRHHHLPQSYGKALRRAIALSGLTKRVTAHSFRHGFATAYLKSGGAIHELKELMGHANIETTERYLHCLPQLSTRARSPLDEGMNIHPIRNQA